MAVDYVRPLPLGSYNPFENRMDSQGRPVWGTEGVSRPDTTNEGTEWQFNYNGTPYMRIGAETMPDYVKKYQGQVIYDPVKGYAVPTSLGNEFRGPADFWTDFGPLIAGGALGGIAAFGGAAGAGAAGGLEGAGGFGATDAWGLTGADLGTSALPWTTNPSLGALGGTQGAAGGGFSLTDPSTWSNPFSSFGGGGSSNGPTDSWGLQSGDYGGAFGSGTGGTGGGMDLSSLLGGNNGWLNLAGNLGGGLLNYLAAQKAAGIQSDAANQANATLWAMYNQNRADQLPYMQAGYGALGNLTNLTTPGKQLDTAMLDPGYQFRYDEGMKQLENQLRAAGKFYSGDALKAGQQYGQNFATGEFGNVFNRNAALAGIGQTATNQSGSQGQTTAGNVANNLLGQGNVRASGYVGGANAITGGIGNYLNYSNQNNLLAALLGGRTY